MIIIIISTFPFFHREFIYPTRTYSRSSFTSINNIIRKFFMFIFIVVRFVIEANQIHFICQSILYSIIMIIESGSYRACRVFSVTYLCQEASGFSTFSILLFSYFITYTPHNNRRMITVAVNHRRKISFCPLIKQNVISVMVLSDTPFIESLNLNKESHFVTQLQKFRCRWIM